jgi:hypothetical protein
MVADLLLERDAVISDCGKYRYMLRRAWDYTKPRLLFIMLNPSTADAEIDDPTIRSCIRLSTCLGYGSFEVVNVFGLRATNPKELAAAEDPIGPLNERISAAAIVRSDMVVCAWGAHPMAMRKTGHMLSLIRLYRPAAYCFGSTKDGAPKHPLYIKSGTPLQIYVEPPGLAA